MPTLSSELRNQFARVITSARREAESGARKVIESLSVDRREPHGAMSVDERALRNRLRAHGRQLGDALDRSSGLQEIDRLVHEVAYEHWHRMLFARFLAQNQLLIEPDSGVAISMAECEEIARERGEDPWALAGRFAQGMLPRIFRPDDPALEVALAPETRQTLERLLASLPPNVFTATDSLGWTYQFWQAEKKDEVNASGVKIGADELPAVTQLFTEHYMVLFLLHNTIGAWRAGKVMLSQPKLAMSASTEKDLRRAMRLGALNGYDFSYLRFVRDAREGDDEGKPTGAWRPAAGAFEDWPRNAAELRVLDPCCGSGHFLVEALELLVRLRMEEEGLPIETAMHVVLEENLFGLEIDGRCTQIAAFSLALSAWTSVGRPIELPPLPIACSGLGIGVSREEWAALAPAEHNLQIAMRWLYDEFKNARELGSLLDPSRSSAAKVVDWQDLEPVLARALEREDVKRNPDSFEAGVAAQGLARAVQLLTGKYTLVVTNVPYLGRGMQTEVLKTFADANYKEARADLATIFLSRILKWLGTTGTTAVVTPQNWLFLSRYRRLREDLLAHRTWGLVARLGPGAFETIGGHVVNVALSVISASKPEPNGHMAGLEASAGRTPEEKARLLLGEAAAVDEPKSETGTGREPVATCEEDTADLEAGCAGDSLPAADGTVQLMLQAGQLENPEARVVLGVAAVGSRLAVLADSYQGIGTSDNAQFLYRFWEPPDVTADFRYVQIAPDSPSLVSGCSCVLFWEEGTGRYYRHAMGLKAEGRLGGWKSGGEAWERMGVAVSVTGRPIAALYLGTMFDTTMAAVIPKSPEHLPAVFACLADSGFEARVRQLDQALSLTEHSLLKVPFDLACWQRSAADVYPQGIPEPMSDSPTQWVFHGHPASSAMTASLQVAVARLVGYRWPAERDKSMRIDPAARAWVERCSELVPLADGDGIVCLSALRGELAAADRLRQLLAAAYGAEWSAAKERELLVAAAADSSPATSLEEWIQDRLFEEHCRLFHHRPFVWHIWDGLRDGFQAFVNYHRLAGPNGQGRRTLEALTYSYLGDWVERQKADQREGKEGADARLAAAQDLQVQLERILTGEPPYDLFVRWKPLHAQPIGWDPDINDGVRLNIRPFLSAELRTGGRKGAGVLRWKPNIKWEKDRGKEPQSLRPKAEFAWFWRCPGEGSLAERTDFVGGAEFDGNRWNDLHYSVAAKLAARERAAREGGA